MKSTVSWRRTPTCRRSQSREQSRTSRPSIEHAVPRRGRRAGRRGPPGWTSPRPTAPITARREPAGIRRDTSRSAGRAGLVGEGDAVERRSRPRRVRRDTRRAAPRAARPRPGSRRCARRGPSSARFGPTRGRCAGAGCRPSSRTRRRRRGRPGVIAPAATRKTPSTSTAAVPTALRMPTKVLKFACSRDVSMPRCIRLSLRSCTRSSSKRSEPYAFTTAIAESASFATEAIAPSCARWRRAAVRIRARNVKATTARNGTTASHASASSGSRRNVTTSIPIEQDGRLDDAAERGGEHVSDRVRVSGHPRDQVALLPLLVEAEREPLQAVVDGDAHVVADPLAGTLEPEVRGVLRQAPTRGRSPGRAPPIAARIRSSRVRARSRPCGRGRCSRGRA